MAATQVSTARQASERRVETIADAVALPLDVVRQSLPQRGLPVYLGLGALTVANVIEWPIAIAAGLGYVALREWKRPAAAETGPEPEQR
jgi:hypothetical protein